MKIFISPEGAETKNAVLIRSEHKDPLAAVESYFGDSVSKVVQINNYLLPIGKSREETFGFYIYPLGHDSDVHNLTGVDCYVAWEAKE